MYEWAVNALMVACGYLRRVYGERTCRVSWSGFGGRVTTHKMSASVATTQMKQVMLVFKPRDRRSRDEAHGGAACPPCDDIQT